jgi:hypothetical protein
MPVARKTNPDSDPRPRRRPAATLDARENQMISLAVDLAEKQLREGTASAQVITHFLKQGTIREQLEQEKLKGEVGLIHVRAEQAATGKNVEELYQKALDAMRSYSGQPPLENDDDDN